MKKILKFSAVWCGPCKMLTTMLAGQDLGVPVEEVDIDKEQALTEKFGVRGVPTLVMVDNDKEVGRLVGMQSIERIREWAK